MIDSLHFQTELKNKNKPPPGRSILMCRCNGHCHCTCHCSVLPHQRHRHDLDSDPSACPCFCHDPASSYHASGLCETTSSMTCTYKCSLFLHNLKKSLCLFDIKMQKHNILKNNYQGLFICDYTNWCSNILMF